MPEAAASGAIKSLWSDTLKTSSELFKIMIPAVMVTKLLEVLGLSTVLSFMLSPVMELMGLPGSLGIVWATALISSPYGALAVFASLAPGMDLSGEQITVLCSVILIAHSLPVELSITRRAGGPVLPLALLRLAGALVYGIVLHKFCFITGVWQDPVSLMFSGGMASATLWQWIWSQIINLALIFFVIFCILTAMRLLRMVGFLRLVEVILTPILPFFRIDPSCGTGDRGGHDYGTWIRWGIDYSRDDRWENDETGSFQLSCLDGTVSRAC